MSKQPRVLLLDDGELQSIREVLEKLPIQFENRRGETRREDLESPYDLIVTSVRRAPVASTLSAEEAGKAVTLCVHNQDFLPLRERLRNLGIDFLIHNRTNPEVLRLLFVHLLYRGPEKRGGLRLLIGSKVEVSIAGHSSSATLMDLSSEGCRLQCPSPEAPGTRLRVVLPEGLSPGGKLELAGRIARVEPDESAQATQTRAMAVVFDALGPSESEAVEAILRGRSIGTQVTRLSDDDGREGAEREAARDEILTEEILLEELELRTEPRVSYRTEIAALRGEATRILLGRDLSRQGMRLESSSGLRLGDEFDIALHGAGAENPLRVHAIVARDDGSKGTVLRFLERDADVIARLERMVSDAASIESGASAERGGIVVSTLARDP